MKKPKTAQTLDVFWITSTIILLWCVVTFVPNPWPKTPKAYRWPEIFLPVGFVQSF